MLVPAFPEKELLPLSRRERAARAKRERVRGCLLQANGLFYFPRRRPDVLRGRPDDPVVLALLDDM